MIKESLISLVDKVIGKTGQLHSPAWWMHRIFSKIDEELTAVKDKVAALVPKVDTNTKYIDTVAPLIDSYFSQPIEFEATYKGTIKYKYGNLYGDGDWVEKTSSNTTAETTEKFKFYGNLNFYADDSSYNTTLSSLTLPNGTLFLNAKKMFYWLAKLATLELPDGVKLGADASRMFYNCAALTTLDMGGWDTSKVTNMNNMFNYCEALTTVTGPITGIKRTLYLGYSPLTNESAMVFINGLAEVSETRTITFKATTYATLTEAQIAIATSKGWTVASA